MNVPRVFEGTRLYESWLRLKFRIIPFAEMWRAEIPSGDDFVRVTHGLIGNVVHAAGAIEYTVEKIDAAFENERAFLEASGSARGGGDRAQWTQPRRTSLRVREPSVLAKPASSTSSPISCLKPSTRSSQTCSRR